MKKLLMVGIVAAATAAMAAGTTISLADAAAKIAEAVESSDVMASLMKQLSAADQVAFLGKVNRAIAKQPGSQAEIAAKYIAVNSTALRNAASKDNIAALLAETFATVPLEVLTLVNERFASDLFNRAADPSKKFSDEQYTKIASNLLQKIMQRTANEDNAGVRNTFAVLTFLRASNGSPADLAEKLVAEFSDEKIKGYALNEWIPAAMSPEKNYDPMLGAGDAGDSPDAALVMSIAGDMSTVALLSDLSSGINPAGGTFTSGLFTDGLTGLPAFSEDNTRLYRIPRTLDPEKKWYGGYRRGEATGETREPGGYPGQRIY